MKELYILRHGETEWNVARRMQGRLDSPLTELGRQQAVDNGKRLKMLGGVEQLCVSPSGRTMETAFLVNSVVKSHIEYFDELMERDCGEWSGLTIDFISERYPDAWQSREQDPYGFRPPGGENLSDMLGRVNELLDDLYASNFERLALITHGVMSKVILKYFLNLNEVQAARIRHPNDLVYRLTFSASDIDTHYFRGSDDPEPGPLYDDSQVVVQKI